MKTKPTSLRFDQNDLLLGVNKSGIKKTQKLMDSLLAEYVRDLKPQFQSLPKDFIEITGPISAVSKNGNVIVKDITKPPATSNYTIDTRPQTLDQLKALCPSDLIGFEKSAWIANERQKYGI